jgi:hypothetical protein
MTTRAAVASAVVFAGVLGVAASARADDTIRHPGDNPKYVLEIEPHLLAGYYSPYPDPSPGIGFGARFSIPLVDPGFVPSINDTIAITFGADVLLYNKAVVAFPVAMQWNFYVAQRWSVMGEPGLEIDAGDGVHIRPALWAGARYHFNDHLALTMRVGFPTFSVGLSFW